MEKMPYFKKLLFAKAFLNYWRTKAKAVEIGRLKSCRRLKVMDLSSISGQHDMTIRLTKIANTTLKEHYTNLKYIILQDELFQNEEVVVSSSMNPQYGSVALTLSRDLATKMSIMKIVRENSNIQLEQLELNYITSSSYSSLVYTFPGTVSKLRECKHLEEDYIGVHNWIRRAKNTIDFINRIALKIENLEGLYWRAHSYKIEFMGITESNSSAEDILKSAFSITDPNGRVSRQRGYRVGAQDVPKKKTSQEIINDFVNNVILPSREEQV